MSEDFIKKLYNSWEKSVDKRKLDQLAIAEEMECAPLSYSSYAETLSEWLDIANSVGPLIEDDDLEYVDYTASLEVIYGGITATDKNIIMSNLRMVNPSWIISQCYHDRELVHGLTLENPYIKGLVYMYTHMGWIVYEHN